MAKLGEGETSEKLKVNGEEKDISEIDGFEDGTKVVIGGEEWTAKASYKLDENGNETNELGAVDYFVKENDDGTKDYLKVVMDQNGGTKIISRTDGKDEEGKDVSAVSVYDVDNAAVDSDYSSIESIGKNTDAQSQALQESFDKIFEGSAAAEGALDALMDIVGKEGDGTLFALIDKYDSDKDSGDGFIQNIMYNVKDSEARDKFLDAVIDSYKNVMDPANGYSEYEKELATGVMVDEFRDSFNYNAHATLNQYTDFAEKIIDAEDKSVLDNIIANYPEDANIFDDIAHKYSDGTQERILPEETINSFINHVTDLINEKGIEKDANGNAIGIKDEYQKLYNQEMDYLIENKNIDSLTNLLGIAPSQLNENTVSDIVSIAEEFPEQKDKLMENLKTNVITPLISSAANGDGDSVNKLNTLFKTLIENGQSGYVENIMNMEGLNAETLAKVVDGEIVDSFDIHSDGFNKIYDSVMGQSIDPNNETSVAVLSSILNKAVQYSDDNKIGEILNKLSGDGAEVLGNVLKSFGEKNSNLSGLLDVNIANDDSSQSVASYLMDKCINNPENENLKDTFNVILDQLASDNPEELKKALDKFSQLPDEAKEYINDAFKEYKDAHGESFSDSISSLSREEKSYYDQLLGFYYSEF